MNFNQPLMIFGPTRISPKSHQMGSSNAIANSWEAKFNKEPAYGSLKSLKDHLFTPVVNKKNIGNK